MKEKPIPLYAHEVRAILKDRQTQLRRIVKPQPEQIDGPVIEWCHPRSGCIAAETTHELAAHCPYGAVGDRLWCREAWAVDAPLDQVRRECEDMLGGIGHGPYYRADEVHENTGLTWRPSIFMPRWASRITLEIVGVRVERLQEITEEDAQAEGMKAAEGHLYRPLGSKEPMRQYTHRQAFESLWDSINGKRAPWASNPWVWVVSFKQVLP